MGDRTVRMIPVCRCSDCPYAERHYGQWECRKLDRFLANKDQKLPDAMPPTWCPLPNHPTANEAGYSGTGERHD